MKFKNQNIDIGDYILVVENKNEFGDKLNCERRHIGIVRSMEDWNGDKSISITHKDVKKYKEEVIEGFKDLFFSLKLWRNIEKANCGIWSVKHFSESLIKSIHVLK